MQHSSRKEILPISQNSAFNNENYGICSLHPLFTLLFYLLFLK